MSAGLDSLGSVEFANALSQRLGMAVPSTLVFDYPSARAVTEFLAAELSARGGAESGAEAEELQAWSESDADDGEERIRTREVRRRRAFGRRSRARAAAPDADGLREHVALHVSAALRDVLGETVGEDEPLMSAGLDSLGSVEFANALNQRLGVSLSSTAVFDYPSARAMATHLVEVLSAQQRASADSEEDGQTTSSGATVWSEASSDASPRSVVRASARAQLGRPLRIACAAQQAALRGGAGQGALSSAPEADAIQRIPLQRWDLDLPQGALQPGDDSMLPAQFGAFMRDLDRFDPSAFHLSPGEAAAMDPQHRVVLGLATEVVATWQGARASVPKGTPPSSPLTDAGVFVGISWTEYAALGEASAAPLSAYTAQGAVLSVCPG
ncbi:hypothetical protein H632_c3413p0, partial [Helicosporidium sp. ATCC 50920]